MPELIDQLFDCRVRLRAALAENHLSAVAVLEQQIEFLLEALGGAAPECLGPKAGDCRASPV